MLRNTFLAVLTVLAVAVSSQAEIQLTTTMTPLSQGELVQWQVNAVGSTGEVLNTFAQINVTPGGTGAGIHNVSQAFTNAGTPSVGQHSPGLWNEAWTPYDSYFKFAGAADLALDLGTPLAETSNNSTTGMLGLPTTPGAPMSGYGNLTSGADSAKVLVPGKAGASINFLQLVLKAGEQALLDVEIVGDAGASRQVFTDFVVGGGGPEPVAPVAVDAPGLTGTAGAQFSHQFTTSAGDTPITWEGLTLVAGGPTPPNAATLSNTGLFSWNAAQAPLGRYQWDVTARNAAGTDVGRIAIDVVIPEPATISLIGLAMLGVAGIFRRHR
jgi:hypothetical protein